MATVTKADPATIRRVARTLWNLVEPIASSVYFLPEAQAAYAAAGVPDYGASYFCSRSACMGQCHGAVVAAAFGVFNPAIVLPAVATGWAATTADTLLDARLQGAVGGLTRIWNEAGVSLDGMPRATAILRRAGDAAATSPAGFSGRPLFAGLHSLGLPGDGGVGDLWRAADIVREHRGDSHVAAWTALRLSAVEVTLLTELWWGGRTGRYIRTRGWDDAAIADGIQSLQERGFLTKPAEGGEPAFTKAGEDLRAVLEEMTDQGEAVIVDAIGADADELFALLEPLAAAVLAAGGYPRDPGSLPNAQ